MPCSKSNQPVISVINHAISPIMAVAHCPTASRLLAAKRWLRQVGWWATLLVILFCPLLSHAAGSGQLDSGDTAWVLISTTLVLLMTLPGLALFYAGMVRKKNILATMAHSFAATAMTSVIWIVLGYSLAFGHGEFNQLIGSFEHTLLSHIVLTELTGTIPTLLFITFQMTFAIIAVAILAGAIAERMKFGSFMAFIAAWVLLVYVPVCHWIWGGGWLMSDGALDFAGGTVVHINAGVSGLVLAAVLGKRRGYQREPIAPANLTLTLIGTGLLWVGWFGFNGGSALAANSLAANALLVTQAAAAAGALVWFFMERLLRSHASVLGGASGAIAGLVGITPAAGFVTVGGGLMIGFLTSFVCFYSVNYLKRVLKVDDSLDAFALHGVGGIVGAILTAMFVSPVVTGKPLPVSIWLQIWIQLKGVLAVIGYSGLVTYALAKLLQVTLGLRVSDEHEYVGLDLAVHGERIE